MKMFLAAKTFYFISYVVPCYNKTPFGTLAIHWHPQKPLRISSQGNATVGGINVRGVVKYGDFRPIESYISETVQDMR